MTVKLKRLLRSHNNRKIHTENKESLKERISGDIMTLQDFLNSLKAKIFFLLEMLIGPLYRLQHISRKITS